MKIGILFVSCIALVALASVVPGPYQSTVSVRAGGPVLESTSLPTGVAADLKQACGDCHSNDTRWPWYSRVAPMSWMVSRDVAQGRKFMNFSTWPAYGSSGQGQLLGLAAERIADGSMPPDRYRLLHPEAQWTTEQRASMLAALRAESARLLAAPTTHP